MRVKPKEEEKKCAIEIMNTDKNLMSFDEYNFVIA
jgi:hypothetical protein